MKLSSKLFVPLLASLALVLAACGGGGPNVDTFNLTVNVTGQGTVVSTPPGISAPGTTSATFAPNTQVALAATPATAGDTVTWGGACSSASGNTCTVTMDASKTASVTFGSSGGGDPTLTVNVSGQGTVTSSPPGISAPGTTSASFAPNTQVTLTATPTTAGTAITWGGACGGASGNTCTVTMDASKTASVTFGSGGGGGTRYEVGSMFLTSGDLELNRDVGVREPFHQLVGLRFVPTLPSGVTLNNVTSAVIRFNAVQGNRSNLTVSISAQAAANPATFTSAPFDISSRSTTNATVSWAVEGWGSDFNPAVQGSSPDVSGLMREAGWTSGNAVVFVIEGDLTSNGTRNAYSFEGAGSNADRIPRLVITYGAGQTLEVPIAQGSDDAEEALTAFTNARRLLD